MKRMTGFVAVLLLLSISFCVNQEISSLEKQNDTQVVHPSCSDQTMATRSANKLAFELTPRFRTDGNVVFSPFSISTILSMLLLGARGETAKQLESVMEFQSGNISSQQIFESFRDLCESIVSNEKGKEDKVLISNGLFLQNGFDIAPEFTLGLSTYYHASVESLDFANRSDESMNTINYWVNNKTQGKISQLLSKPLPISTRMFLTNAVYFKGTWRMQFPAERTFEDHFYVNENYHKIVPMMSIANKKFRYLKDEETNYKYLELFYEGNKTSMLLALPLEYDKPATLAVDSDLFCRINANLDETKLDIVSIPKFQIEYENDLKDELTGVGIVDAFLPNLANFAGIHPSIFVSEIKHKAVIEVNEVGSEAAAITGAIFRPVILREVPEFVANHPFLFYIIDKPTSTIIFSGIVNEP